MSSCEPYHSLCSRKNSLVDNSIYPHRLSSQIIIVVKLKVGSRYSRLSSGSFNGLIAVVAGASGISGTGVIRLLSESPSDGARYMQCPVEVIHYCLTLNMEHKPADLLNSSHKDIGETLLQHGVNSYVWDKHA